MEQARPSFYKIRSGFFFLFMAISLIPAHALIRTIPMKVTVQQGDSVEFPPFVHWTDADTQPSVSLVTPPAHGTVQIIPNYFRDRENRYAKYYTRPHICVSPSFPALRYIPAAGFSGRDTFIFKIRSGSDSTAPTTCAVMVHPPEPGNMTVLLVVNEDFLGRIRPEVDRLKQDLEHEGYRAKIKPFPFPPTLDANPYNATVTDTLWTKRLWDSLVIEYDRNDQMVAGAILIGRLPYSQYTCQGSESIIKDASYWCMSAWLRTEELKDTAGTEFLTGIKAGRGGMYGGLYMRGVPNIWVSRMISINGYANRQIRAGGDTTLVKRALQANHDYRTGASRLPHTAHFYDFFLNKNVDAQKLRDIWPSLNKRAYSDTVNPVNVEFKKGGEVWDILCHSRSNSGYFTLSAGKSFWTVWAMDPVTPDPNVQPEAHVLASHMPFRFVLAQNCHVGGPGGVAMMNILARNGGCVLSIGSADYTQNKGELSPSDTSYWIGGNRLRKYLSQGERWGRAWIRSNMSLWATAAYGDFSLKPMMAPANELPVVRSFQAVRTGGLDWEFTVGAEDPDGAVKQYYWYPKGYDYGRTDAADSGARLTSFRHTYPQAMRCTVRVEVCDSFKAWNYAELIIRTDSGVVGFVIPPAATIETALPSVAPGGFSLAPSPFSGPLAVHLTLKSAQQVKIGIYTPNGRLIRRIEDNIHPVGPVTLAWDGCDEWGRDLPAGVYLLRVARGTENLSRRIVKVR